MKVVDDAGNELPPGEVGEIAVRGHNVMKGYWNRQDATAEVLRDGWLLTGDLARVDEGGYFFIVDRKKEMIIRGGFNVYPRELEEVLYEHPAVLEAAVIGVPDEAMGEEVAAAVVLRPGHDASADDIRGFVKERLAAYKYPRHVCSSMSCRRARPARSSSARSPPRCRCPRDDSAVAAAGAGAAGSEAETSASLPCGGHPAVSQIRSWRGSCRRGRGQSRGTARDRSRRLQATR